MKQSRIKSLTNRNLSVSLSKIDEVKCPNLFAMIKAIIKTKEDNDSRFQA